MLPHGKGGPGSGRRRSTPVPGKTGSREEWRRGRRARGARGEQARQPGEGGRGPGRGGRPQWGLDG